MRRCQSVSALRYRVRSLRATFDRPPRTHKPRRLRAANVEAQPQVGNPKWCDGDAFSDSSFRVFVFKVRCALFPFSTNLHHGFQDLEAWNVETHQRGDTTIIRQLSCSPSSFADLGDDDHNLTLDTYILYFSVPSDFKS